MRKTVIFSLLMMALPMIVAAQFAVNTPHPIGAFLVDGKSSPSTQNTSSTPSDLQQSDDFVVLDNAQ